MNIFQEVKSYVTARQAAEQYGIRVGRNQMACCPFHDDHHPSMKIDTNYYCFACGAKGDVIGLTAGLFGLSPYEAASKLIADFQLPLTAEKCQERRKKYRNRNPVSVKEKMTDWHRHAVKVLTDYLSWIRFWKRFYGSEPDAFEQEQFLEALDNERKINDYLDILLTGSGEEIAEFFICKRKEVAEIEQHVERYQQRVHAEVRAYCRK